MVHGLEPATEVEEARKQFHTLSQTNLVVGYVQNFQELQYQTLGMIDEGNIPCFSVYTTVAPTRTHWDHMQGNLDTVIGHDPTSRSLSWW